MRYRSLMLMVPLALLAAGCSKDSPTAPTTGTAKFTATLLPSNEVPAIANADATGSGTVTITINTQKDAAGNVTSATADFTVTMSGFPANEALTGAHIHPGVAGTTGGVIWNTGLASGEITTSAAGAATFTKNAASPTDFALAQAIIANPAGYYFNVHTTLNTGGAIRGQLRAN